MATMSTTDEAYLKLNSTDNSTIEEKNTIEQNINDVYDKIAEFVPHYIWLLTSLVLFILLLISCCIHIICYVSKKHRKKKRNDEPFVSYTPGSARILSSPNENSLSLANIMMTTALNRSQQSDYEQVPKVSYAAPRFKHPPKPVPTIVTPTLNKIKVPKCTSEVTECHYSNLGSLMRESVPLAATFYGMDSNNSAVENEGPKYNNAAVHPSNSYNYQTAGEDEEYEDAEKYFKNKVPPMTSQSLSYQSKICTPAINTDEEAEYDDVENFVGNASNYTPYVPELPNKTLNTNKTYTKLTMEHPQEEDEYHDISEYSPPAMKYSSEIAIKPTLPSRIKPVEDEEEAEYDDVSNFPVRPPSYNDAPALPARKTTGNMQNHITPLSANFSKPETTKISETSSMKYSSEIPIRTTLPSRIKPVEEEEAEYDDVSNFSVRPPSYNDAPALPARKATGKTQNNFTPSSTNFSKPETTKLSVTSTLPNTKMWMPNSVVSLQSEEAEYDDIGNLNLEPRPPSLPPRKVNKPRDGESDDDAVYMDIDETSATNSVPRHENQPMLPVIKGQSLKNLPVFKNQSQLFNIFQP